MITALSKAIFARLAGTEVLIGDAGTAQSELAGLLAEDPDTGLPAVFFGNKNRAQATDTFGNPLPLYPCVTFRPSGGTVDRRFVQETGAVESVLYDVEIWEDGASGTTLTEIAERLERLLDTRRGVVSVLPLERGQVYQFQAFSPLRVLYDEEIHAWVGLIRYLFQVVRY